MSKSIRIANYAVISIALRIWLCLVILFTGKLTYSQTGQKSAAGVLERLHPALDAIINKKDLKLVTIAQGFEWVEGPLWIPDKKMLLFSDIPRNSIYKWTKEKGKELYLTPSGYTGSIPRGGETGSNALLLNSKGQLVLCQHGDRKIALMDAPLANPRPEFITLADNYKGKKFDSPNDAAYGNNGDLYFTDPPYGLEHKVKDTLKAAPYQGVYKLSESGQVTLLTDSITRPNGIAFFPGKKTLLIANSDPLKPVWYIYDVDKEGMLANGRVFYNAMAASKKDRGMPDGLKIDKNGNVFASGPGGIWIFNKEGVVLGKIKVNGVASNCAFANNDKTLFITSDDKILKIDLR